MAEDKLPLVIVGMDRVMHGDGPSTLKQAIREVMEGGEKFATHYIGCKDYEGWVMQGFGWTSNGFAPTHGRVVFRVAGAHGQTFPLTDKEKVLALAQLGVTMDDTLPKMIELYRDRVEAGRLAIVQTAGLWATALQNHQYSDAEKMKRQVDERGRQMWQDVLHLQALMDVSQLPVDL